jgi:predicted RNA polymerase sigma factor
MELQEDRAVLKVTVQKLGDEAMPEVAADVRLAEYQPYWAARAELLTKRGAYGEARHAYEIAIGLEREPAVRRFLKQRQSALPA